MRMTIVCAVAVFLALALRAAAVAQPPGSCGPNLVDSPVAALGIDGHLYVKPSGDHRIYRVNLETGISWWYASDTYGPLTMSVGPSGDLWIPRFYGNFIRRLTAVSARPTVYPTDIPPNTGVYASAVSPTGLVYLATGIPGAIYEYDPSTLETRAVVVNDGALSTFPSTPLTMRLLSDGRLAILDSQRKIFTVDIDTAEVQELTGPNTGSGPQLSDSLAMLERDNGNLLVTGHFFRIFYEVDIVTGDRTQLSEVDFLHEQGPTTWMTHVFDEQEGKVVLVSHTINSNDGVMVHSADVTTGETELLVAGGFLSNTVVLPDGRVIAARPFSGLLADVDMESGALEPLFEGGLTGPDAIHGLSDMVFDGVSRLIYSDASRREIGSIDILTGEKLVISSDDVGSGPTFRPQSLALLMNGDIVVASRDSLFRVDAATGDRQIVSDPPLIGDGVDIHNITDVVVLPSEDFALIADPLPEQVVWINLVSGDRIVLSSNDVGAGFWNQPTGLTLDSEGALFVKATGIYQVDLQTGDKTGVGGGLDSSGDPPRYTDMDFLPDGRLIVAGDVDFLAVMDLELGTRSYLGDDDGDNQPDACDNCLGMDFTQHDADEDGFGNLCDADFNNDCRTNTIDLGILRTTYSTDDLVTDMNRNGVVNVDELGYLRSMAYTPPGPSALATCGSSH